MVKKALQYLIAHNEGYFESSTDYIYGNIDRKWLRVNSKELHYLDDKLGNEVKKIEGSFPFENKCEEDIFLKAKERIHTSNFVSNVGRVQILKPGVAVKDGRVIIDSVSHPESHRYKKAIRKAALRNPVREVKRLLGLENNKDTQCVGTAAILCGCYDENYYHWVTEHLPKIRFIRRYEKKTGKKVKLIIKEDSPRYVRDSLNLLGINRKRLKVWKRENIIVENFICPAYPDLTPDNLRWVRSSLSKASRRSGEKRIYISRKYASNRKVVNENKLFEILKKKNFEKVYAERLSLKDQIDLFKNAKVIVGPHGAGLSNMVWSKRAKVLEIQNRHIRNHFYHLSKSIGHEYLPMRARSLDTRNKNSDMRVNLSTVKNKLKKILP